MEIHIYELKGGEFMLDIRGTTVDDSINSFYKTKEEIIEKVRELLPSEHE